MNDLYQAVLKIQEAYALLHHIPIERQFSDREIGPVVAELEQIETEVYGKQWNGTKLIFPKK